MLTDTLYLILQLAKLAIVAGAMYAGTYAVMSF
jgi:hypothetical protein